MISLDDMIALTDNIIDGNLDLEEMTLEELGAINQYLEDLENIMCKISEIGKVRRY